MSRIAQIEMVADHSKMELEGFPMFQTATPGNTGKKNSAIVYAALALQGAIFLSGAAFVAILGLA